MHNLIPDQVRATFNSWGVPVMASHDLPGDAYDLVTASVDIPGASVALVVQCTHPFGHWLVRRLMQLEPGSEVEHDLVIDTVAEVANVVAGGLAMGLPECGTIGLPQVSLSDRLYARIYPSYLVVPRAALHGAGWLSVGVSPWPTPNPTWSQDAVPHRG